jgi:hypothetical protein
MNLSEFLILSDERQYQAVWELGVHIDNIVYNRVHHQLYTISDFYIEIHYSVSDNKIIGKLAFRSSDTLDKYLRNYLK